ncbi:hypothetical protein L6269_03695, partial [Candidatus Dependentiae bacterium]|nr:hypothetical protein [Candidatus Dependentiae bacterium]
DAQISWNSSAILNIGKDISYISSATINNANNISYNSSAIIAGLECCENNSNAIVNLAGQIKGISDATIQNDSAISWNSSAILNIGKDISYISSATINNANNISYNSSAIIAGLECCENNSNAIVNLAGQIKGISDATIQNDSAISWNSSAILNIGKDISYISSATINNANNISYNSSAIISGLACCENNSNAIVSLANDVSHISSATIHNNDQIRWNSSAILNLDSSSLLQQIINNSNAIINHNNQIHYNSQAIVSISYDTSLSVYNSNAIINLSECCDELSYISSATINNANNIHYNSQAIVSISIENDLIIYNSNAIVNLSECCDELSYISNATIFNNTQINNLQIQLNTIDHGPSNIHVDSNMTLSFNIYLGDATDYEHKLYAHGGAPVTLDGSGRYVHFSRDAVNDLLIIDDNTTLILENIVLKDFLPRYVDLGTNSDLIFGDGTTIELGEDFSMPTTGLSTFKFQGDVIINGYGHAFHICPVSNAIQVASGSNLIIENTRLEGLRNYNVRCLGPNAHITYRNDILVLCNDYTFSDGTMTFSHDVTIKGKDHSFTYKSPEISTVVRDETLLIDRDVEFIYDAGNADRSEARKTAFILQDDSAILYLNGCTLHSTRTGLQLDQGTLIFDDKVTLISDALYDVEALSISNDVHQQILSTAMVDAYGIINIEQ